MHKYLIVLIFFSLSKVIPCTCSGVSLIDRIQNSDFITTAKILKVSSNEKNSGEHNINIEIIELFKGQATNKLKVYSMLNSSCAFLPPEGSEWLVFANKNKNGDLSFGYCSGAIRLDRKFNSDKYPHVEKSYKKSIERKLQVLQYFKTNGIESKNEFKLRYYFSNDCLDQFKGIEIIKDRFAFFELVINPDLSIKNVKVLKHFGNEQIKKELLKCAKENVEIYSQKKVKQIIKKSKIIVGLYYYESERGNQSFISQFDL